MFGKMEQLWTDIRDINWTKKGKMGTQPVKNRLTRMKSSQYIFSVLFQKTCIGIVGGNIPSIRLMSAPGRRYIESEGGWWRLCILMA